MKTKNLNLSHWPSRKLFPLWMGPFTVLHQVNPVSYELHIPRHWRIHDVFHVNLLKPWKDNGQGHPPSPFTYLAGQPYEYEVDSIIDHWPRSVQSMNDLPLKARKNMKFLVRWRHYGADHDTWEPFINLRHAPAAIESYWLGL